MVDHISYQRVVENAGATWDYFPGHFDPDYAQAQGNPTIYVNTMHLAGFADRVATEWAGPRSRVMRRSMRLTGSVYAGDTMTGRGGRWPNGGTPRWTRRAAWSTSKSR
ncbi:maoC like domain protein [Mycobacterium intracellulare]|nr:maoC like domain protein [Mycobacterium intracellulare]